MGQCKLLGMGATECTDEVCLVFKISVENKRSLVLINISVMVALDNTKGKILSPTLTQIQFSLVL